MKQLTHEDFRKCGFTGNAINFPLSEEAFVWLCKFNGLKPEQVPETWKYAPNAYMQKYLHERAINEQA